MKFIFLRTWLKQLIYPNACAMGFRLSCCNSLLINAGGNLDNITNFMILLFQNVVNFVKIISVSMSCRSKYL